MDGTLDTSCNLWTLHWTHDVNYGRIKITRPCIAILWFSSPVFTTQSPVIAQNSPLIAQNSTSTWILRRVYEKYFERVELNCKKIAKIAKKKSKIPSKVKKISLKVTILQTHEIFWNSSIRDPRAPLILFIDFI